MQLLLQIKTLIPRDINFSGISGFSRSSLIQPSEYERWQITFTKTFVNKQLSHGNEDEAYRYWILFVNDKFVYMRVVKMSAFYLSLFVFVGRYFEFRKQKLNILSRFNISMFVYVFLFSVVLCNLYLIVIYREGCQGNTVVKNY